ITDFSWFLARLHVSRRIHAHQFTPILVEKSHSQYPGRGRFGVNGCGDLYVVIASECDALRDRTRPGADTNRCLSTVTSPVVFHAVSPSSKPPFTLTVRAVVSAHNRWQASKRNVSAGTVWLRKFLVIWGSVQLSLPFRAFCGYAFFCLQATQSRRGKTFT